MPKRAFQITGQQPGLSVVAPTLFQAEQDFLAFERERRGETRQRKQLDFEAGTIAYASYEKSLREDLESFNPDSPEYGDLYARLLGVREKRQSLQDADMMDKFDRGVLSGDRIKNYFNTRIAETAAETPEWFGLQGAQRASYLVDLQRQADFVNAQFSEGAIQLTEYLHRLQEISQGGGFVENSPVSIGLQSKMRSGRLQSELDELAEQFELAQGEELLGLVDRLNEVKDRFSIGSDVRRQVFGVKQDILNTAYGQFSQLEQRSFSDIFGRATSQTQLGLDIAGEFGDFEQALKGQELLFGLAQERAERTTPLGLREFATQRPLLEERTAPFRSLAAQISGTTPSFADIREAQKEQEREVVKIGSLLKPFEGF